ncbi:MAG TPA: hypothetical protein VFD58_32800 [Blastocatellia bacterium]|nr:hypothetical protein [Blastocatellia bacterium]
MIPHPFSRLPQAKYTRWFWALFTFFLAMMLVQVFFNAPLKNDVAEQGILSFELARTPAEADEIIRSWEEPEQHSARIGLYWDYLYLVAYSSWIAMCCVLAARWLSIIGKWRAVAGTIIVGIGAILAWAQFGAALCDAAENFALLRELSGSRDALWPVVARNCARVKFGIAYAGIGYFLLGLPAAAVKLFLKAGKSRSKSKPDGEENRADKENAGDH